MNRRLLPLVAPLLAGGAQAQFTINIFDQGSPYNRDVGDLMLLAAAFSVIVLIGMIWAIIHVIVKGRKHVGDEPPQFSGNNRLEVTLVAVPTLIVSILFFATIETIGDIDFHSQPDDALVVEVTGHQYWWNFVYQESGVRTANELVIPTGRPVYFEMTSADVIHSFWVPNLGGKTDTVPGQTTRMHLTADRPGVYYGQCTELCGPSHANMRLRVIAVPEAQFAAWLSGAQAFVAAPVSASAQQGQAVFQAQCASCHTVKGTNAQGVIGPDLSFMGERTTIGSGVWPNTPEYMQSWISDSPGMKPGSKMPAFPNLTPAQLADLTAYLESLRSANFPDLALVEE